MAIYEWHLAPDDDERLLELSLVSTRRRGEVALRSIDAGVPMLVDEAEIAAFLSTFERVSLRRAGHVRDGQHEDRLESAAV